MPDQPIQQPIDPIDSATASQAKARNEFGGPVHHALLEQESADRKEHGHRDILHEVAAAPVDTAAIAPLVERAERDADQRYRRRKPAPAGLPAHRPVVQDQRNAGKPDQQPAPLHRGHAFAQPAVRDGRRQDRLQARDQRRKASRNRQRDRDRRAAEVNAVHQNAGDGAVPDLDAVRPCGPGDGAMTAIRPTTIAMRIARYVKGSALLTTYLVPMKPVLHSRTKIAGAARAANFEVLGHLPSLLPDHMLCGKNRSRRATGAISHIEACSKISNEERHGCSRRRRRRCWKAAGSNDCSARGTARGRSAGRDQGDRRLSHRRIHIVRRRSGRMFPAILGHEGAGVVVDIGKGVTSVKKAITSFRCTRRNAGSARPACRARPISAPRSAPRKARA